MRLMAVRPVYCMCRASALSIVSFRQICMIFCDRLAIVISHGNQPNGADDDDSDAIHANWREP